MAGVILGIAQLRRMMPDMSMWVWLGLSAAAVVATAISWWRESA